MTGNVRLEERPPQAPGLQRPVCEEAGDHRRHANEPLPAVRRSSDRRRLRRGGLIAAEMPIWQAQSPRSMLRRSAVSFWRVRGAPLGGLAE